MIIQDSKIYFREELNKVFNSSVHELTIIYLSHFLEKFIMVDKFQTDKKFFVRPNPVSGKSIFISFDGSDAKISEVNVFDVLGREIYKRNISLSGSSQEQIEIPIGNLQNGIYYARLIVNSKIVTEKFEVMR